MAGVMVVLFQRPPPLYIPQVNIPGMSEAGAIVHGSSWRVKSLASAEMTCSAKVAPISLYQRSQISPRVSPCLWATFGVCAPRPRGHRPFHDPAGRVDVVNNVQRRWILHPGERLHQVEHVLAVVEVPRPRILNLHHHGIQPLKRFLVKHDMVRSRCQLRVPGTEQSLEVSPFREQVVHVPSLRRVPAVLCAEAPDRPSSSALSS